MQIPLQGPTNPVPRHRGRPGIHLDAKVRPMPRKPKPSCCDETQDAFDRKSQLTSATDCTGLVPSGVQDDSQSESYHDLYDIHQQKPHRHT